MNFKRLSPLIAFFILLVAGCSTDPEVNWNKLESYTLVTCELYPYKRSEEIFRQEVIIQQLRPLVGYAFDPDRDRSFGIPGAQVSISDSNSIYPFSDVGTGLYIWEDEEENLVNAGSWYRLEITLPDGRFAFAETIYPIINFSYDPDTIWVYPDSVLEWSNSPGETRPVAVEGEQFMHVIRFNLPSGTMLSWPRKYPYGPGLGINAPHLWIYFDITDSSLTLRSVTDSLSILDAIFVPYNASISFSAQNQWDYYLGEMRKERTWPVETLESFSNVEGAYGIFTTFGYHLRREYVVALKP